jgi:hypothetical protein
MVAQQPEAWEGRHAIRSLVGLPSRQIPNRNGNVEVRQGIQRILHRFTVGDARLGQRPAADPQHVIRSVVRVNVAGAVAGRPQTGHQGQFARTTSPGEPAEIARLLAVEYIVQHGARRRIGKRLSGQSDGIELAICRGQQTYGQECKQCQNRNSRAGARGDGNSPGDGVYAHRFGCLLHQSNERFRGAQTGNPPGVPKKDLESALMAANHTRFIFCCLAGSS